MTDHQKSKEDLIAELRGLRIRVAELERTESELKRVADALKQSETMFRKLTEKSIVGVYLIQDNLFRYVNPKLAEIVGYEVHELIDKRGPEDVVFRYDWPLVKHNLEQRISGEVEAMQYQFRGIRRNGEITHLEAYGSRMYYHSRPAVIGTLVDITRRVGVEHNLEIQLEKFQTLYHLAVAITAERRLEENLRLVVEKSRELLAADMGFIALRGDNLEELHVRARSGMTVDGFNRLRVPPEAASQSKTVQIGQGHFPKDYFHQLQKNFPDSLVSAGIVSGLAMPINLGGTNLGALCVCCRTTTPYNESEIETLSLMSNLAALVITRKQAEEGLAQSEKQLRLLSRRLLTAQEDERKRVAQDLHDGIGQSLTAMKFEVENAIRKIAEQVSEPHLRPLQAIFPMIHDTIEEVGQIAMDLRPSILDHLGVLATVAWVCREFKKTHSDIRLEKQIDLEEDQISEHQKIVIFRILQEALNNVAKHSRSNLVQVWLLNIDGCVELTIKDNGVGFDCEGGVPDDIYGRGFGLASMKERARLSGGSFSVEASQGAGTVVKASWPEDGAQPTAQQSRFL